jgi:hypothetical protein
VVDLTEPGEYNLRPYWPLLTGASHGRWSKSRGGSGRFLISGRPTRTQMRAILDDLDSALQSGCVVYVHCFGGIGRTGTVVGCYLVNQGMSGDAALETITQLRQPLPKGYRPSPETAAQRALVRTWRT